MPENQQSEGAPLLNQYQGALPAEPYVETQPVQQPLSPAPGPEYSGGLPQKDPDVSNNSGQSAAQTLPSALPPTPTPVNNAGDAFKNNDVIGEAKRQFPILDRPDVVYGYGKADDGRMLESYPPGEDWRPKEYPIDKLGVEVYSQKTRPEDVLGDVVSHHLINADPKVKQYYDNFVSSLNPDQQARLHQQYEHEKQKYQEDRPYDAWAQASGIPAYFRGYTFHQWPNTEKLYTPQQMKNLDELNAYLRAPKGR
jgi:hypothetical protein